VEESSAFSIARYAVVENLVEGGEFIVVDIGPAL
jgi:hypothetical protein